MGRLIILLVGTVMFAVVWIAGCGLVAALGFLISSGGV